ncbi:MAG: pitrilysin family protein [Rhodobacteraceae bacterium]|nr:pitrilysin family protein [Paracoccaceae bacterium]
MNAVVSRLANGFTVATDTMPGLKSVAIALYVKAGSRNERPEQNGIAHFLEHMAFKGTTTRSASDIARTIEDAGGSLNAYTSRDRTAYTVRILSEDTALAIELLADIVLNSTFAAEEIERERKVIVNEIHQYRDYPEEMVMEALQRMLYPDQAFGRPVIGTLEHVRGFGRGDLQGFIEEHYQPANMILVAAGDVDHARLLDLARGHFGHLDGVPVPPSEAPHFAGGESRQAKRVEQTQFVLAFEAPKLRSEMEIPALAWSVIMGYGSSSRLFDEVREKRGLCYSISAGYMPALETGTMIIHAATRREDLRELAECCIDEIRRSAMDLDEEEIRRARTQVRVGILMGYESPFNRVERAGGMIASFDRIETIEETNERFQAVTRDQIETYVRDMICNRDLSVALYGPLGRAPRRAALQARLRAGPCWD